MLPKVKVKEYTQCFDPKFYLSTISIRHYILCRSDFSDTKSIDFVSNRFKMTVTNFELLKFGIYLYMIERCLVCVCVCLFHRVGKYCAKKLVSLISVSLF